MEVFGFCALTVRETPAGSLRVEQSPRVPIGEAFTCSEALVYLPELNWKGAASEPLTALGEGRAALHELLEEISLKPATELMMVANTVGGARQIAKARQELSLSSQDLIIPYRQTELARERWLSVVDWILQRSDDLRGELTRLGFVGERAQTERWLDLATRRLKDGRRLAESRRHGLDLFSPDLELRLLLGAGEPWTAIRAAPGFELVTFKSREEMLEWAAGQLERPAAEPSRLPAHLRELWAGEPIDARLVGAERPRLKAGALSGPADSRGYLRISPASLSEPQRRRIAPHALPGGMVHPGLAPIESRPLPDGRLALTAPLGVWG